MPICNGRTCNGADRPAAEFGRNAANRATGLQTRCRRCLAADRQLLPKKERKPDLRGAELAAVLAQLVRELLAARGVLRAAHRDEIATGIDVALYRVRELQRRQALPIERDRDLAAEVDTAAGAAVVRRAFGAAAAARDRDDEHNDTAPGQSL